MIYVRAWDVTVPAATPAEIERWCHLERQEKALAAELKEAFVALDIYCACLGLTVAEGVALAKEHS
jgi:hypothetical protein